MASKRTTKRVVKKAAKRTPPRPTRSKPSKPALKRVVRKKPEKSPTPRRPAAPSGESIDAKLRTLDRDIIKLLNNRADLTIRRLTVRQDRQEPLFDPLAEQELWQRVDSQNGGPLSPSAVH